MAFNLSDLNNLDFNNIGSWPLPAKAMAVAMICVAVAFLGYWFDISDQLNVLNEARQREEALKKDFEDKHSKAVNLEAYRSQMKEMEESFGTMLRQLPSKTEVADLLVDITQTGLASGLTFELFKPEKEAPQEFYVELPITITVSGDYHQFGAFVSVVAALPRIVTLHDISIKKGNTGSKNGGGGGPLLMQATAKTYRYLGEEEIAAQKAKENKR